MDPTTPRKRIDGWLVLAAALVLSVLISWGTLSDAMHGKTDILAAGAHYLVGLALSWAGVFGFASLVSAYSASAEAAEAGPAAALRPGAPTAPGPERRTGEPGGDAPAGTTAPGSEAPVPATPSGGD